MRKILIFLLSLSLVVGLALSVQAASEKYDVSEMDLSLEIPSEYIVFTREMEKDDPAWLDYGISKQDLMDQFTARHIYLNAVLPNGNEEIVVTMEENIITEFNGLGDTSLLMLASSLKDGYEEHGIFVSSYDIYHHPQLEFIRIYFNTEDKTTYGLQYYTIYGGQAMNFTMRSYDGPISRTQENTIQNVVNSIDLHFYVPIKSPFEETPAFVHIDPDTGTTFTVPANWSVQPFSKKREVLDIQFFCEEDPALMISYASNDLWTELTFFERLYMNRLKTEELLSSTEYIAEMMDIPESEISKKVFNDEDYYFIETSYATEMYGTNFSGKINQVIHIEDGWAYMFNFYGESGNPHFDEFVQLIKSVEYGDMGSSGTGTGWIIMTTAVVIVLCVLFVRRRTADPKIATEKENKAVQNKNPVQQGFFYCHRCGNRLPADSLFCNVCGTRLVEKEGKR